MKKLISALGMLIVSVLTAATLLAQDTTPRGPSQWTGRNWLGFCIYIGIFILAIIGIYRLAMSGEGEEGSEKSEIQKP